MTDAAAAAPLAETGDRVHLNSRVGGSDKDYVVALEPKDGGWVVNFAFGKRGSTLRPGCKSNKGPTSWADARKLYDKVVRGQLAEGYTVVGGAAAVYVAGPDQKEHAGIQLQLLTPVGEAEALLLNADPAWLAQEKHDGKRMALRKSGELVRAINRKGLYVGFPQLIEGAARAIVADFVIDGEAVGEQLRAFDILELDGRDLRAEPVEARLLALAGLLRGLNSDAIVLVATARTAEEKAALYARLLAEDREGVVYKRMGSRYEAGRPKKGGDQLKRKFYETASFVVAGLNDQRSVRLQLLDASGAWVSVGDCTIPPNHAIPAPGAVVEVRYLYAYEGGALAQPSYLGPRTDIDAVECVVGQLKFKSSDEARVREEVGGG